MCLRYVFRTGGNFRESSGSEHWFRGRQRAGPRSDGASSPGPGQDGSGPAGPSPGGHPAHGPEAAAALLDRVRKLLTKAESDGVTAAEAEALTAKAAELMAKYGIDRALLAARRPETDHPGRPEN